MLGTGALSFRVMKSYLQDFAARFVFLKEVSGNYVYVLFRLIKHFSYNRESGLYIEMVQDNKGSNNYKK